MKKILFSVLAVIFCQFGFSQTFMHGVGIISFVQSAPGFTTSVNAGFIYSPRINFMENDNTSLSIGIPFSVGATASYSTSSYDGQSNNLSVMLDAPLILNFNVGAGSSRDAESRFGFFAGGGFGYHASTYELDDFYGDGYSEKMAGFGPVGNVGIRIGVGQQSRNVEIRFSYMKSLDVSKSNIFGIGGLFNF